MINILIGQSDRPNRVDGTKKNKDYHAAFARYCVFYGYNYLHQAFIAKTKLNKRFYTGDQWRETEDLEQFLMDDTGQIRNRIKVVKNFIRPMMHQYRGNAIRMQIKARVKSISTKAINRREEKLAEMLFLTKMVGKLREDGADAIADHIKSRMPIGNNEHETQQIFENIYVDEFVRNMNYLTQYISEETRINAKQDKTAENLGLSGLGVMETYESSGNQAFKLIESEDFFWDRSAREYDLSDAEFQGTISYLSPTEIFERWPDIPPEARTAIDNYSKEYSSKTITDSNNITMSGKVPVFRTFWKDSEKYTYGYVQDEFGYPLLVRIGHIYDGDEKPRYTEKDLIDPPTPKAKKLFKGKKIRPMYIDELRFCEMIPKELLASGNSGNQSGEDVILDHGISGYVEIENERPAHVKFPFKCYCWGYLDGQVLSPVDDIINPQRFVNRLMSVAENQINNSRGSGIVYDRDMVDSQSKENELLRNANQSKPIGISAKGRGVQNVMGSYDGTIKQGTMVMFDIVNTMKSYIQDVTGVNEPLQGQSTGADQLVGVTQLMIQRGSLLQEPFYNAINEIFMQCYQSMLTFGKKVYCDNERQLAIAVGDKGAEILKITKDHMAEDFRAFVYRENGEEVLINAGNSQLTMFLQMGLIDDKKFADLYNRSTPDDISRGLREAATERIEVARMTKEEKDKKAKQLQDMIAQNNEAQITGQKIAERKAADQDSKDKQHDMDKLVVGGMMKRAIGHDKAKAQMAVEHIKKGEKAKEE